MYNRIVIFGRPGSGKSTFAKKIATQLNLPLYHLDKYFFIENWVERDYSEFINMQLEIVNKPQWVVDGNGLRSLSLRWSRADLVLYFDYPRLLCLMRLIKRFLKPDYDIDDRAPGCEEILRARLIKYMWLFDKRASQDVFLLLQQYPQIPFLKIRNNQELSNAQDFAS
jgi:adenylate kinase family enzyme